MISLYGFGANLGVTDPSPFVVKVETFLKMASLPYQRVDRGSNLKKSPKGKLPFISIKDANQEQVIADSQHIIEQLTDKYNVTLDEHLTEEQKAQAYLMTKSLDENLYWCLVYSRWVQQDTWPHVKQAFFGKFPSYLRWFVPNLVRKSVIKTLNGQGLGRHSEDEILAITDKSLQALSHVLGAKDYFFGEQVCSFDATAYALLCQFFSVNYQDKFNQKAKNYPNLIQYCQRIEQQYFL